MPTLTDCVRKYTELYGRVRRMTRTELSSVTGCRPMCQYYQYHILKLETLNNVEGLGGISNNSTFVKYCETFFSRFPASSSQQWNNSRNRNLHLQSSDNGFKLWWISGSFCWILISNILWLVCGCYNIVQTVLFKRLQE